MRHGRTALNDPKNPVVRGWRDEQLSPEGKLDVQLAANRLKQYDPKYIYHSDFMRDTQTAEIVASILNIPIETDFDSRTWDVGNYSGQPEGEANPPIIELYKRPWERPPGSSESFNDFSRRFVSFMERKLNYAASSDAMRPMLIVTHGRCVAVAQSHFTGENTWKCSMPLPAGYAVISVATDGAVRFEFAGKYEPVIEDV